MYEGIDMLLDRWCMLSGQPVSKTGSGVDAIATGINMLACGSHYVVMFPSTHAVFQEMSYVGIQPVAPYARDHTLI